MEFAASGAEGEPCLCPRVGGVQIDRMGPGCTNPVGGRR